MQKIKTLMEGIESQEAGIPLILRVKGKKVAGFVQGGTSAVQEQNEVYVCLSQLPEELRERVKTAVTMLLRA